MKSNRGVRFSTFDIETKWSNETQGVNSYGTCSTFLLKYQCGDHVTLRIYGNHFLWLLKTGKGATAFTF
ncbi:hypothetical protein MPTK1_8g08980 [Marchantia polymorpha subsp. ruderalis]|uniref:Uncharacterized protein n=1 Tax=Marchantia polymorpha TaxID=3197 RepID=A0A2R6WRN5_MARPO|nr:hypothetical protein MARPO_0063s0021 [Marchantia polymorpha]BBN19239.1 hypothetical protein Mp_8g08980 [Marchantia polymorpha subsp. ruderalis]|eukprot:PTQ36473.1 hypothetical protein MARPO_0063s0021 [Marchantia polymorpha]